MPTDKKLEEVEEMFKTASKPNKIIEDIDVISKVGVIYDNTTQGENALRLATDLANNLNLPLKAFTTDDFYLTMKLITDEIKNKGNEMLKHIDDFADKNDVKIESELLVGRKIMKIIEMMDDKMRDEEKLSYLIIKKLIDENFSIFVAGSPLMRKSEDTGTLGYYLSILLKEYDIHTNFLLVPDRLAERADLILGFALYRQKTGTTSAILRRALSVKKREKQIKIVGLIEDNTIETIARSELSDTEADDFETKLVEVTERIKSKYNDDLMSIDISENFNAEFTTEVEIGTIDSTVKIVLERYKPGLVLVRSVSQLDEHLNPDAETIARIALSEGYPVFILWD